MASFIELLGLPKDASHEQIHQEMKWASEAQTRLIESNKSEASRKVLEWEIQLLKQREVTPRNAILFWEWFFDYDAEHKLGFMDAEMAKEGFAS